MFLQAPADTTDFMILGFAVIFGTMGLYALSFISRFRNLRKDYALMQEIEQGKNT